MTIVRKIVTKFPDNLATSTICDILPKCPTLIFSPNVFLEALEKRIKATDFVGRCNAEHRSEVKTATIFVRTTSSRQSRNRDRDDSRRRYSGESRSRNRSPNPRGSQQHSRSRSLGDRNLGRTVFSARIINTQQRNVAHTRTDKPESNDFVY